MSTIGVKPWEFGINGWIATKLDNLAVTATDDRYANFSASTRPTEARSVSSKLYSGQAATRKISSAAWPSFFGLNFWNLIVYHVLCFCGMFTGYHSTRWFLTLRACGAPLTRPGGRATLSCPPGPRLRSLNSATGIHCLQCLTTSYTNIPA